MKSTIENLVELEQVPLYLCHKKVRALKIDRILGMLGGRVTVRFENFPEGMHSQIEVDTANRPVPQAGWYYVIYEDGYESFTPAEAFEAGYSRIQQAVAEFHVHDVPSTLPEHSGSVLRVVKPAEGESC